MSPDGKVWFGVYNNGFVHGEHSQALNDGQWHQVVGTMEPSGADALRRRQEDRLATPAPPSAQPYTGYWRIGGDTAWNGNAVLQRDHRRRRHLPDRAVRSRRCSSTSSRAVARSTSRPVPRTPTARRSGMPTRTSTGASVTPTATAKDSGPNESNGIYQGGYTQGQNGAFDGATNKAVAFNGSDGFVASAPAVQQPEELHPGGVVQDHHQRRGKIIGFGCSQTGTSGCYDRHVYMSNDGKVTFGVWTGFTNTITSPTALNDGNWHYVMATQSTTDGHEALHRRSAGRHQRPDRRPGLRRLLAGGRRQPLGLLQPVHRRHHRRGRGLLLGAPRERSCAALPAGWRQRRQPAAGGGVQPQRDVPADLGQRIDARPTRTAPSRPTRGTGATAHRWAPGRRRRTPTRRPAPTPSPSR